MCISEGRGTQLCNEKVSSITSGSLRRWAPLHHVKINTHHASRCRTTGVLHECCRCTILRRRFRSWRRSRDLPHCDRTRRDLQRATPREEILLSAQRAARCRRGQPHWGGKGGIRGSRLFESHRCCEFELTRTNSPAIAIASFLFLQCTANPKPTPASRRRRSPRNLSGCN